MSLKGRTVAITRPREQADELAEIIASRGGRPRIVPTVEIKRLTDLEPVKQFTAKLIAGEVDIVVFMSRNGVTELLEASNSLGLKDELIQALGRTKTVAIGSKTRKQLENQGVRVDLTPSDHTSTGIIGVLMSLDLRGKLVAIPRTDSHSEYLKRALEVASARVLEFPVYSSAAPSDTREVASFIDELLRGEIDVITFTSSATARNLFKIAEERRLENRLKKCLESKVTVAAIGPVTKRTLEELGAPVHAMPTEYTIEAMVAALDDYLDKVKR